MHQMYFVSVCTDGDIDASFNQGSPDSTLTISNVSDNNESTDSSILQVLKKTFQWCQPTTLESYPKNIYLLPTLLFLNHLVAIGELVCAIWINSLGLFGHGSHMIFNSIILTGLITSVLINWREDRCYSLSYIDLVVKANLLLGIIFLGNGIVIAYISLRNAIDPPEIRYESLFYLVPVPALPLNLVGIYVILNGDEESERDEERETKTILQGQMPTAYESVGNSIYRHMLANAWGSVGTIISTILVQNFGWTVADTICAAFIGGLMIVCAVALIKESIDLTVTRRNSRVFSVTHYVKNEIHQLANIFTV